jgi:predicted ATPase
MADGSRSRCNSTGCSGHKAAELSDGTLRYLLWVAAQRSQVVVVSHAPALIDALQQLPECHSIMLEKRFGETVLAGDEPDTAAWHWPSR